MFPSNKGKEFFLQSSTQAERNFIIFLETLRLMFNEFLDENDLKSNLTTKINQRENTRDILVPRTTLKLSIFILTLHNLKVACKKLFLI